MADPFEMLRISNAPVDPDLEFAARLRARLLRAFDLPRGVTVSNLALETTITAEPELTGPVAVVPYLAVAGARQAIDWYAEAFGARLLGDPIVMPDDRVGHAELEIPAGGRIMLSEEHPEIGVLAPSPEGVSVTLYLSVPDVDALIARAVRAGAHLDREIADYEYGRNGVIRDPFGHRWLVATEPVAAPTDLGPTASRLRHGDVGYISLWVRDTERAARFFSGVLGWRCALTEDRRAWIVQELSLHHGIDPGHDDPTLFVCYSVADIRAACEAVRSAGGDAEEPVVEPWGTTAMCTDTEGMRFAVYEPTEGIAPAGSPPPAQGALPGDLAYITMYARSSAATREFYGTVLGWDWRPGRVEDGWGAIDPVPMTGLSGGHQRTFIQPMYRVEDVEAAVARVRELGGTSTDPEVMPYGITAECEDDQGTRFYLGQL